MSAGNLSNSWSPAYCKLLLLCLLGALLVLAAACQPKAPPTMEQYKTPSRVVTQDGVEYSVWRLRLPGTSQDLKVKNVRSYIWMPLSLIQFIRFSGPVKDQYRQAEIYLLAGDRLRGELFVGQIIEGTTDLGYWNMPLENVTLLSMGIE